MRRDQGYNISNFQPGRLNFDYGFGSKTARLCPKMQARFFAYRFFFYLRNMIGVRQVASFVEATTLYHLRCCPARTVERNAKKA